MKKIISILLTTVLLMSCITLTAFAAGTQNPTITGANVEIPYGTTTAAVTFSVSEITYQDYGMWIVFDDGLSVSKVKVGPASQSPEDANSFRTFGYNKNTNLVATMGGDELTTSGVLFTVTFNVPANAAVGTSYDVSVEIDTVRNDANEYLTVDVVSGSITIVCNEHKWDYGTVTKEPCCHELGEKTFNCTNNGCTGTKTEPVSATGNHVWDNGTVTKEPGCNSTGIKTYKCTTVGCTESWTEDIPATGIHVFDKENGVYGYDDNHHWLICSCGELGEKEGHIWKWVEDKKPTTTEFGSKHEECEICGHKRNLNTPVDKLEEGKDDVPQTGDITPYIVMSFVILLALIVAAAYTLKRKFAK